MYAHAYFTLSWAGYIFILVVAVDFFQKTQECPKSPQFFSAVSRTGVCINHLIGIMKDRVIESVT